MTQICFDARQLVLYPVGKPSRFVGGTETYLHTIAAGLAANGHTVHVVCPDLDRMEQRAPNLYYWTPKNFPNNVEVLVLIPDMQNLRDYVKAEKVIVATNGVDTFVGDNDELAQYADAFACFSMKHVELLCQTRPSIKPETCFVTGLGIKLSDYEPRWGAYGTIDALRQWDFPQKVPGRIFVSNDPARGLFHVLDIFDLVKKQVPHATLHIGYDFDRQFNLRKWQASAMSQWMWEMKARIDTTSGIVSLGEIDRETLIREQLECQAHVWPSDPPNLGSQIHGLLQMECAAAGCALVLSDIEAFPECFGEAATILPVPGKFFPELERRFDAADWAEAVVPLMLDHEKWTEASAKARALAEKWDWSVVVNNWCRMLTALTAGAKEKAA